MDKYHINVIVVTPWQMIMPRLGWRLRGALTPRACPGQHWCDSHRLWTAARQESDAAGALWSLLTHRLGTFLESTALYGATAWVFVHSRRGIVLSRNHQQTELSAQEAQNQGQTCASVCLRSIRKPNRR